FCVRCDSYSRQIRDRQWPGTHGQVKDTLQKIPARAVLQIANNEELCPGGLSKEAIVPCCIKRERTEDRLLDLPGIPRAVLRNWELLLICRKVWPGFLLRVCCWWRPFRLVLPADLLESSVPCKQ